MELFIYIKIMIFLSLIEKRDKTFNIIETIWNISSKAKVRTIIIICVSQTTWVSTTVANTFN